MVIATEIYFNWLYQQQVIKYCRVSPISIWAFDFCVTFADEVHLLSGQKHWGLTHLLYIPTRYFPILTALCIAYNALMTSRPLETCVSLYKTAEIVLMIGMLASEGLLLIRTLALWNTQYTAQKLLVGIYIVVAIVIQTTASVPTVLATQLSRVTVGMFSSAAFFELVIIFFTVLYASRLHARIDKGSTTRLIGVVIQGNMLYALSLFVASIVNITFYVLPLQDGWNALFVSFQGIFHGAMASRILFELRDALSEGQILRQVFTGSRMEFESVLTRIYVDEL
ncbi:hypothetical protein V8B97DRAFT_1980200 [Scleroderma yunnanense]